MTGKPDDMEEKKEEEFRVQSYTQKQLADAYRTPERTFRKWLERIRPAVGERIGHFYNPKQVKIITDHLGKPFIWIAMIGAKMFGIDTDHDDPDGGNWFGNEGKMLK